MLDRYGQCGTERIFLSCPHSGAMQSQRAGSGAMGDLLWSDSQVGPMRQANLASLYTLMQTYKENQKIFTRLAIVISHAAYSLHEKICGPQTDLRHS